MHANQWKQRSDGKDWQNFPTEGVRVVESGDIAGCHMGGGCDFPFVDGAPGLAAKVFCDEPGRDEGA